MNVISLYWFAAQQQINTFKPQRIGLLHPKFGVDFYELGFSF